MGDKVFEIIADHKNGYREMIGKDTDLTNATKRAKEAFELSLSIERVRVLRLSIIRKEAYSISIEEGTLRLFP